TSGAIRKPRASSGSDASSLSRTGVLPQLENSTRWRAENRPLEVAEVILAWDSDTLPTWRSPSATPEAAAATLDVARTPQGTCPARVDTPEGGVNSTVARPSP